MIDFINITTASVIMTFQRCIEYLFYPAKSIIRHREIGSDTLSFSGGVEQTQFQDPDVLVIGELPDAKTMEFILNAAQTGKLVLITFSSAGVVMALQKLVHAFPAEKQYYARKTLSQCLVGVIFQKFLPGKSGESAQQVAATEVLVNSPDVGDSIREGLLDKISTIIQNDSHFGMRSLEKSVKELLESGLIAKETAEQFNI
jgi:Tfp pilus assembly protein, pilus retraction ATPase PilT